MALKNLPAIVDPSKSREREDHKLIDVLDGMWQEGKMHREAVNPVKRRERDRALYRGEIGPEGHAECLYKLNFVQAFIDRQIAQLTDNRPIERITARKLGLRGVARIEEKLCRQDWDAYDMQRQAVMVATHAALEGAAGMLTMYDPRTTDPVVLKLLTMGDMVVDPAVTVAARVCSDAQYFGYQQIWTCDELVEAFPGKGHLVKSDEALEDLTPKGIGSVTSPALKWIHREGREHDGPLERAVVRTMFVRDLRREPGGQRLFPGGRLVMYAGDTVLWDGPNIYWDGEWPIDLFEWTPDPEHVYGRSGVELLREAQLAFNALMNGTVETRILTNFITFIAEHGSLDTAGWQQLSGLSGTNVIKVMTRGARLDMIPPPPIAGDAIQLAKVILTYCQMVTGVTDVTLGESPGSLQSGMAIEGLQEGANLMTRARASRLEDFYGRVGQKLIARHMQFVSADDVLALVGATMETKEGSKPNQDALAYAMYRRGFFVDEKGKAVTVEQRMRALRDFKFGVVPGSSAPGARQKRAMLLGELAMRGMVPSWMVLEAAGFDNPKELAQEGNNEMVQKAPMMAAMKGMGK